MPVEATNPSKMAVSEDEKATLESEETAEESEWQDLLGSGCIMKKLVKSGTSETKPDRQQICTLNYELTLDDGTVVERQDQFEVQLGDCEVIQGLDVALGLMDVGEKCILKIQPRLAFGALGLLPKIPPNSTVVYEIELVSAVNEPEIEEMTVAQRKLRGNKKRERGNYWYGRGDNSIAIQCYRRALDYLDEVEGGISYHREKKEEVSDAELQDLLENRVSVSNNMAAAQIKLELYDAALASLQAVLRCQPNNVKALFRKAKICRAKNDLTGALKCLKKADLVSPNNQDVQKEILVINKLLQKQKVTEKELAKRMFGDQFSKDKKKPKRNMLIWSATLAASCAVGLAGIAAYRLKFA